MTHHPSLYSHRALRPASRSIREWRVDLLRRDGAVAIGRAHQDVRGRAGRLEWEDPSHPGEIGVDRWFQGSGGPSRTLVEAYLPPEDAAIPGRGHPGRDCRSSRDLLALR